MWKNKILSLVLTTIFVLSTIFVITNIKVEGSNGTTLYVGGSGLGNYTTIQSAIDNANDNDTVFMYSGMYYEAVVINKSINLFGEDRNNTIIEGWLESKSVSITCDWILLSGFTLYGLYLDSSSNNTITGNTITHSIDYGLTLHDSSRYNTIVENTITNNTRSGIDLNYGSNRNNIVGNTITHNSGGINLDSSSNTITGNIITSNTAWGISLGGINNTVTGNTITNNSHNGISLAGYGSGNNTVKENIITHNNENGISLSFSSDNNIIMKNTITNNTDYGINLFYYEGYFSKNNTIQSNTIKNNSIGMCLDYRCDNNIIRENIITHNTDYGLGIFFSDSNIIMRNVIKHNNDNIYLDSSSSNTITGNTITHSADYGIYLDSSSNYNIIIDNTITNNKGYGIYLSLGSRDNKIYHNNFINNSIQVTAEEVNAWDNGYPSGGNYWDDYVGIDANSDHIGDTPYFIQGGDNLDRYPFMMSYNLTTNQQPTCTISASPTSGAVPLTVTFTITASDPDGIIIFWIMDIDNDGIPDYTSMGHLPSTKQHTYTNWGNYTANLTVTDNKGATDTESIIIVVNEEANQKPIASFTFSKEWLKATFKDKSNDADGYITDWYWNFGDGTFSVLKNPVHTYDDEGSYAVALTVTDNNGDTDTYSKIITIATEKEDGNGTPGFEVALLIIALISLIMVVLKKR